MEVTIESHGKKLSAIQIIPKDASQDVVGRGSVGQGLGGQGLMGQGLVGQGLLGMVVFAHGSGSGRFSERNTFVAHELHKRHLGTLMVDLLTDAESSDRRKVFDVELLAERLISVRDWLREQTATANIPCAYFGASTGAAAALLAAAKRPDDVLAIVSRGGRPDLVPDWDLTKVKVPTLFIVGGNDPDVLEFNRKAFVALSAPKKLEIVPGAGHLFEEPGALEDVSRLAGDWFLEHMAQPPLQLTGTCG